MPETNTQEPCASSDDPSTSSQADASNIPSLVQRLLADSNYQDHMNIAEDYVRTIDSATATGDDVIIQVLVAYRKDEFEDMKFYLSTNRFCRTKHAALRGLYRKCYARWASKMDAWKRPKFAYPLPIAGKYSPAWKIHNTALDEVFRRIGQYPTYKINYDMLSRLTSTTRKEINDYMCLRQIEDKKVEMAKCTYELSIQNGQINIDAIKGTTKSDLIFTLCDGLLDEDCFNDYMPAAEKFLKSLDKTSISDRDVLLRILIAYRNNEFEIFRELITNNFFLPRNHEAMRELYVRCSRKCLGEDDQLMNGSFHFPSSIVLWKPSDESVTSRPSMVSRTEKPQVDSTTVPTQKLPVCQEKPRAGPGPSESQPAKPLTFRDLAIMKLKEAQAAKKKPLWINRSTSFADQYIEFDRRMKQVDARVDTGRKVAGVARSSWGKKRNDFIRNVEASMELRGNAEEAESLEATNDGSLENVHTEVIHPTDDLVESMEVHGSGRSSREEITNPLNEARPDSILLELEKRNMSYNEEERPDDMTNNTQEDTLAGFQPPEMEQDEMVDEPKEAENQKKESEKLMEVGRSTRLRKRTQPYESQGWKKYPITAKSTPTSSDRKSRCGRLRKSQKTNSQSMKPILEDAAVSSSTKSAGIPQNQDHYQPYQVQKVTTGEPKKKAVWPCYYSWLRSEDAAKKGNQKEVNPESEPVEKRARLLVEEKEKEMKQGASEEHLAENGTVSSWEPLPAGEPENDASNNLALRDEQEQETVTVEQDEEEQEALEEHRTENEAVEEERQKAFCEPIPDGEQANDAPNSVTLMVEQEQEIAPSAPNNYEQDEEERRIEWWEVVEQMDPLLEQILANARNVEVRAEEHHVAAPVDPWIAELPSQVQPNFQLAENQAIEEASSSFENYEVLFEGICFAPKREVEEEVSYPHVEVPIALIEHAEPFVEHVAAPSDPSLPPRCGENFMLWNVAEMAQWILVVSKSEETSKICQGQGMDGESMGEFLCEQVQKDLQIQYFPWRKLTRAAQTMIDSLPRGSR